MKISNYTCGSTVIQSYDSKVSQRQSYRSAVQFGQNAEKSAQKTEPKVKSTWVRTLVGLLGMVGLGVGATFAENPSQTQVAQQDADAKPSLRIRQNKFVDIGEGNRAYSPKKTSELLQGFLEIMQAVQKTDGTLNKGDLDYFKQLKFEAPHPSRDVAKYLSDNYAKIVRRDGNSDALQAKDLVKIWDDSEPHSSGERAVFARLPEFSGGEAINYYNPDKTDELIQGFLEILNQRSKEDGQLTKDELKSYLSLRFAHPAQKVGRRLFEDFDQIAPRDGNRKSIHVEDLVKLWE